VKRNKATFYCFSPPVMIATFVIELGLVLYTVWRYKMSQVTRLVALLLGLLAAFQLAEYMVCRGIMGYAMTWSRIGYMAIALMPPVGVHLVYTLAKAKKRPFLPAAYGSAAAFVGFFMFVPGAMMNYVCQSNYVIFQVAPFAGGLFGLYYYAWLIVTLALGLQYYRASKGNKIREAFAGLMLGYAMFIIPATAANIVDPQAIRGIPSIMCGFAVLLALLLVSTVLPNAAEKKRI